MKNPGSLKVIAAVLAGVVAGTVLGLLFAPGKGADLRKKAMDGAKDLAATLKRKVGNDPLPGGDKESQDNVF